MSRINVITPYTLNSKHNDKIKFGNKESKQQKTDSDVQQIPELKQVDTYKDPLAKWPIRSMAYSNELGTAIGEIAPKLGSLLWVPALMYFGADIYDKYKNKETCYSPSAQRALEQAIFQALASVILPTVAVHTGQKVISEANRVTKQHLSTNAKEETLNFINDFINKSKLSKYDGNFDEYYTKFDTSLKTYISDVSGVEKSKNIFTKIFKWAFSSRHPEAIAQAEENKVTQYAHKILKDLIDARQTLMTDKKPQNISDKVFEKFKNIQETFKKEFGEDHYMHKSAKYALKEHISSEIFKLKMFKTLGGFIALGLLIKPIDMFVEKTIMKKVVEPNIEKINNINFTSTFRKKTNK